VRASSTRTARCATAPACSTCPSPSRTSAGTRARRAALDATGAPRSKGSRSTGLRRIGLGAPRACTTPPCASRAAAGRVKLGCEPCRSPAQGVTRGHKGGCTMLDMGPGSEEATPAVPNELVCACPTRRAAARPGSRAGRPRPPRSSRQSPASESQPKSSKSRQV
jgi:hypothetical protein